MGPFRLPGGLRTQDRRGTAAVEFALVAPVMFLIVLGGAELAIVLNQSLTLTNAVSVGAMQFAFSAGVDATPYSDAVSAIRAAAPDLSSLTITLSVNGTPCATDAACTPALSAGAGYVTATATYSCAGANIVYNLLPNCTIKSQQTERVQ